MSQGITLILPDRENVYETNKIVKNLCWLVKLWQPNGTLDFSRQEKRILT